MKKFTKKDLESFANKYHESLCQVLLSAFPDDTSSEAFSQLDLHVCQYIRILRKLVK